jgi:hypothetical protein
MLRALVVGTCGSGKTTVARSLAERIGAPFVELDALHNGPNWTTRPTFAEDADRATRGSSWVADGNYSDISELLWSRADTIVWLDPPLWLARLRVVRRSLRRWVTQERLYNGNIEPSPLGWVDPEHPVRLIAEQYGRLRARYTARFAEPRWGHLARVRLGSDAEVRTFLVGARSGAVAG